MFKSALIAGFLFVVLSPSIVLAGNRSDRQHNGFNSEYNHASYWGENCKKFEDIKTNTWNATSDDVVKVIIKGGTKVEVYRDGSFTDLTAAINQRSGKPYGISHVIECYGDEKPAEDCDDEKEHTKPDVEQPTKPDTENEKPTQEPEEKPEAPSVLGDTEEKTPTAPAELPKTGIGTFPVALVGLVLGGFTLSLVRAVREEEDEFAHAL